MKQEIVLSAVKSFQVLEEQIKELTSTNVKTAVEEAQLKLSIIGAYFDFRKVFPTLLSIVDLDEQTVVAPAPASTETHPAVVAATAAAVLESVSPVQQELNLPAEDRPSRKVDKPLRRMHPVGEICDNPGCGCHKPVPPETPEEQLLAERKKLLEKNTKVRLLSFANQRYTVDWTASFYERRRDPKITALISDYAADTGLHQVFELKSHDSVNELYNWMIEKQLIHEADRDKTAREYARSMFPPVITPEHIRVVKKGRWCPPKTESDTSAVETAAAAVNHPDVPVQLAGYAASAETAGVEESDDES